MGNCLGNNNKILAEDDDDDKQERPRELAEAAVVLKQTAAFSGRTNTTTPKEKRVRFRLEEDNDDQERISIGGDRGNNANPGDSRNGAVRIRLVVTQEELKQILSFKKNKDLKFSSLEELLSEMKLRGRSTVLEAGKSGNGGSVNGSWSPALESIPEDH